MAELSDRELERYARHIVLRQVGGVGQRKLKATSVAVVGAGGIGSAVIPALAGAGAGRLAITADAEDCDNCAELGVLGALTGTVGNFAALVAINTIVGIGEDSAGMLHLFDGEKLNWRTIRIPVDPGCRACGSA